MMTLIDPRSGRAYPGRRKVPGAFSCPSGVRPLIRPGRSTSPGLLIRSFLVQAQVEEPQVFAVFGPHVATLRKASGIAGNPSNII